MCRHSAIIHTCDCEPKTTFRKCPDQLKAESKSKKKDFKPLECPNYFREPSVRVDAKCCNCLAFDLVIEQSFAPKQPLAYHRRRISLDKKGNEKLRGKSSAAQPSRAATLQPQPQLHQTPPPPSQPARASTAKVVGRKLGEKVKNLMKKFER
ncbi:hypothetical protein BGAL_0043g00400 [Botrytis galanthina]|uniref:Uncharacterized protein n=1 Tax=Botrytis galanthina TaxID=278940 RepID=A0A4S8R706_9HELO|nr:hypothetical protein BGAL_0043g00400 [Botrytis galanthina]